MYHLASDLFIFFEEGKEDACSRVYIFNLFHDADGARPTLFESQGAEQSTPFVVHARNLVCYLVGPSLTLLLHQMRTIGLLVIFIKEK